MNDLHEAGQRQGAAEHRRHQPDDPERAGLLQFDHPLVDHPLGEEPVERRHAGDRQRRDQQRAESDRHKPG